MKEIEKYYVLRNKYTYKYLVNYSATNATVTSELSDNLYSDHNDERLRFLTFEYDILKDFEVVEIEREEIVQFSVSKIMAYADE